jgi:ferric-dicitrate binding protein FerR (iron transport regulator)
MSPSSFRSPLLTLLGLLLVTGNAEAYEGRVILIQGDTQPRVGTVIPAGGRVRTSAGAVVILETTEGARLKLKGASEIEIGDGEHPGARLHRGGVFARIPKMKGPRPAFRIRSKAAVMGVRGTEFYTAYGKSDSEVWMCVREGEVEVDTLKPVKDPVLVKAGQGVWIRENGPPPEAKSFEWTKGLNWNQDPAAGDLVDQTRPGTGYGNPIRYNYD